MLVPYPHATADHQTKNARWIERGGAAVVVPDDELDGPRLAREVAALLGVARPAADDAASGARAGAPGRRGADRSSDPHARVQVIPVMTRSSVEGQAGLFVEEMGNFLLEGVPGAESIGSPPTSPTMHLRLGNFLMSHRVLIVGSLLALWTSITVAVTEFSSVDHLDAVASEDAQERMTRESTSWAEHIANLASTRTALAVTIVGALVLLVRRHWRGAIALALVFPVTQVRGTARQARHRAPAPGREQRAPGRGAGLQLPERALRHQRGGLRDDRVHPHPRFAPRP